MADAADVEDVGLHCLDARQHGVVSTLHHAAVVRCERDEVGPRILSITETSGHVITDQLHNEHKHLTIFMLIQYAW